MGEAGIEVEKVVPEMLSVFESAVIPRLLSISEDAKRYLVFTAWLNTFLEERLIL